MSPWLQELVTDVPKLAIDIAEISHRCYHILCKDLYVYILNVYMRVHRVFVSCYE